MNLAYNLNNNISGEKILRDINRLCSKIPKSDLNSTILVISLQKIVDYQDNTKPLNITYNPEVSLT